MYSDTIGSCKISNGWAASTTSIVALLDVLEYDTYHHIDGWYHRYDTIQLIRQLASYDSYNRRHSILYDQLTSSSSLFSRFWSCMIHTLQLRAPSNVLLQQQNTRQQPQPMIDIRIRMEVCYFLSYFLPCVSNDKSCYAIWPVLETVLVKVIMEAKSSFCSMSRNFDSNQTEGQKKQPDVSFYEEDDRLSLIACHTLYTCISYSPWNHAGNVALSNDLFEKLLSILQSHYQMSDIVDYMNEISSFLLRFLHIIKNDNHRRHKRDQNNHDQNRNSSNKTSSKVQSNSIDHIDRIIFLSSSPAIIEILIFILSFQLDLNKIISCHREHRQQHPQNNQQQDQQIQQHHHVDDSRESKSYCLQILIELIKDPSKQISSGDNEKSAQDKYHDIVHNAGQNHHYQTIKANIANHDRLLVALVNICQYYTIHRSGDVRNHNTQTMKDQAKYLLLQLVPEM